MQTQPQDIKSRTCSNNVQHRPSLFLQLAKIQAMQARSTHETCSSGSACKVPGSIIKSNMSAPQQHNASARFPPPSAFPVRRTRRCSSAQAPTHSDLESSSEPSSAFGSAAAGSGLRFFSAGSLALLLSPHCASKRGCPAVVMLVLM